MKKNLFLLLLLALLPLSTRAQDIIEQPTNKRVLFCKGQLGGAGSGFKTKYTLKLDYGMGEWVMVKDDEGKPLVFLERIAVINYMTLQGWSYVSPISDIYTAGQFLFTKEVTEAEANEILKTLPFKDK